MAFDKNQIVMHQLQVKASRLESGLKRIVGAMKANDVIRNGDESLVSAYQYALGCLGGDYLKKELFETDSFEEVVMQLKEEKYMKADVADKNIEVWREKHNSGNVVKVDANGKGNEATKEPSRTDGVLFGERDEDGEIVPRKNSVVCEFAPKAVVDDKFGGSSSSFGDSVHKPIYCY